MDLAFAHRLFFEEAEELLQENAQLLGLMPALEAQPDGWLQEAIQTLFRNVHTLKGSVAILGYARVEQFMHAFETLLNAIRQAPTRLGEREVDFLFDLHQHLQYLIHALEGDLDAPDSPAEDPQPAQTDALIELCQAWQFEETAQEPPAKATVEKSATPFHPQPEAPASKPSVVSSAIKLNSEMVDRMRLAIHSLGRHLVQLRQVPPSHDRVAYEALVDDMEADWQQLHAATTELNQVPVKQVFQRLVHSVHEISRQAGKPAELHLETAVQSLDKRLADKLFEPLLHLIRNAIDHGLESQAERQQKQKPPVGHLTLRLSPEKGFLTIELVDDGRGLDYDAIAAKARALGWLGEGGSEAVPEGRSENISISHAQAVSWLFKPGFSTRDTVSTLSGRGVGLDVVHNSLRLLRGCIDIRSEQDVGTAFVMQVPQPHSRLRALLFRMGAQLWLVELRHVLQVVPMPGCLRSDCVCWLPFQGEAVTPLNLAFGASEAGGINTLSQRQAIVYVRTHQKIWLICAEEVVQDITVSLMALQPPLDQHPFINGYAMLHDGTVAYALDLLGGVDEALSFA